MLKYSVAVCLVAFCMGAYGAQASENQVNLEKKDDPNTSLASTHKPKNSAVNSLMGYITPVVNTFTNIHFAATNNPEVEKAKFPPLTLKEVSDLFLSDDAAVETILKREIAYVTGNGFTDPTHYKGILSIIEFDYGDVETSYISADTGYKISFKSAAGKVKPKAFLKSFIDSYGETALFDKKTPQKRSDTRTEIEYIFATKKLETPHRQIVLRAIRYHPMEEFL